MSKRPKTRKKAASKKKALKRPGKAQKELVDRLETILARLVPPAVQAMLRPKRLSPDLPALDEPQRQALIHTIVLVERSKSVDAAARYVLDTVPPVPLFLMLGFLECLIARLRRDVQDQEAIRLMKDLDDHDLLVVLLQWFERRTRPDPPEPAGPPDDDPGPLAQGAFVA